MAPVNVSVFACVCDDDTVIFIKKELSDLVLFTLNHCSEYDDALEKVNSEQPDVLILDTGMKCEEPLDFIKNLQYEPYIILVSQSKDEALAAFKAGAADYLLKPIYKNRLGLAMLRAYSTVAGKKALRNMPCDDFILCRDGQAYYPVPMEEVIMIVFRGEEADIITMEKSFAYSPVQRLQARITGYPRFIQAGKNTWISVCGIHSIELKKGYCIAHLSDGKTSVKVDVDIIEKIRQSAI